jgi:hypothetical protein
VLNNLASVSSASISDAHGQDFYLLKNVIKPHDNVIE